MIMVGTCHYISKAWLYKHWLKETVDSKLNEGLIKVGQPELKKGETLGIIKSEGRYYINTPA